MYIRKFRAAKTYKYGYARELLRELEKYKTSDISLQEYLGGGSALLSDPIVPLPDMIETIKVLTARSATIQQVIFWFN